MKKKFVFVLSILLIIGTMTACSKDETLDIYDKAVRSAGELQLTSEKSLVGEKSPGVDAYTGQYFAEYEKFTGEEYIFGGTTINHKAGNKVKVTCNLTTKEGTGKFIFISGSKEPEILVESPGEWSGTIELPEGGNYLYFIADNFSGSIELNVE